MSSSLQPGTLLSHYRIISSLGAGGMGEVYMAQDESLERAVALKILPPDLMKSEERVRRFIQEAKAASSLNHPHIVTIYEIGRAEIRSADAPESAPGGASVHFIAMELISGETLKQKIHQEKTDLRTLVRYLSQAAEGLAKAHSAGIVHRDLKPDNIMISKDGYAKVLDFGLAKLTERKESGGDATSAQTATREQTREGAVMGTVAYMSPEQVQARKVDHRSDIFSFGSILYEAATRSKPFVADSDIEVMHRILRDKPASIEETNPDVPAELRRLVRRCLAKAPEQRLQSMKDLAIELNEIADEYEQLSASATSHATGSKSSAPALAGPGKSRSLHIGLAAAVAVALAAVAFGIYSWVRRPAAAPASTSFQSMKLSRFTTTGNVQQAAISADGKYLANVVNEKGKHSLWVKQVATGSDVQIVKPLDNPFRGVSFSRDGNYVYYVNQETGGPGYSILYQVPVLGGAPRKLLFDVDTTVTFSPDGRQLAFMRGYPADLTGALIVANADGTGERKLLVLKQPDSFAYTAPSWSPDGKRIAAILNSTAGGLHGEIAMIGVDDAKQVPLGTKRWWNLGSVAWVPDGSGVVVTGFEEKTPAQNQIWFVAYPGGQTRKITNDLNQYTDASVTGDSKTLAATQQNQVSNVWIAPLGDTSGGKQVTFGTSNDDAINGVRSMPEGFLFAAAKARIPGIWTMDIEGNHQTRLTPDSEFGFGPAASRDGRTIIYQSLASDGYVHIFRMDRDGGHVTQATQGKGEFNTDISPDGTWIVYTSQSEPGLWRVPISGGAPKKLSERIIDAPSISPDGRRVALSRYKEEGSLLRRTLVVIPAEGGQPIATIPWPDGFAIGWIPGEDALIYAKEVDGVGNLWSQPLDGSAPRQITHFTDLRIFSYDWMPDGKRLVFCRGQQTSDVVLITDFH